MDMIASKPLEVKGGSCPVRHDWAKTSSIIQIRNVRAERWMQNISEKENSPNTEAHQRDTLARETLESALNGASSSKLFWQSSIKFGLRIWASFLDIIGRAVKKLGVESRR